MADTDDKKPNGTLRLILTALAMLAVGGGGGTVASRYLPHADNRNLPAAERQMAAIEGRLRLCETNLARQEWVRAQAEGLIKAQQEIIEELGGLKFAVMQLSADVKRLEGKVDKP